jgi:hypothetical protein
MTQHVRNILKVYRRATTDDIANGVEWYSRAKRYSHHELEDFKVSCYNTMKLKAWSILEDDLTSDDEILDRLNGQKIRSFYSNIRGLDEVTIDGHALNIALGVRQGLTTDKTNMSKKVYKQMQEVYVRAAKRVDIKPHVLQAITWTTWKRENKI